MNCGPGLPAADSFMHADAIRTSIVVATGGPGDHRAGRCVAHTGEPMNSKKKAAIRPLAHACALAVAGLIASTQAHAQVDTTQIPGQGREENDPALRTPPVQPRVIDPAQLTEPAPCPFAGKGTVTLSGIEVTGSTLVPRERIDASVADLIGHSADAQILCTARDRVAAVYARQGEALARVELPEQRISDGVLTLRVTEGRIADVRIENAEALGPAAGLAGDYLGKTRTEGATRWPDVERAFLLARDIPGADVRFALRRADDGSDNGLQAIATFGPRRRFDLGVSVQNMGSEELGRTGVSLRADANSFTRFGERTSLVLYSSHTGAQQVVQLMEEVRLGASGWLLHGDYAYGRSQPEGALEPLELDGRSRVARLGLRYPLLKSRAASIDMGMRLEGIDQQNDLGFLRGPDGDAIPLFDERLRVLALTLDGRWQSTAVPGLATMAGIELRQGLDALGASEAGEPLLSRSEARPDFTSARLNLGTRFAFAPQSRVSPYVQLNGLAQWTRDVLPAYEEFQVGNYTVGRGYDPGAASGDRALGVQAEFGFDIAGNARRYGVFAFADAARVWNYDSLGYDAEPWSAGAGARMRWSSGQLSLVWASPQSAPLPGAPTPGDRVLLTFNHAFSIR